MNSTIASLFRCEIALHRMFAAALLAMVMTGPVIAKGAPCIPDTAPQISGQPTPWYAYWPRKTVQAEWPFGDGGAHMKKTSGKLGRFRLVGESMKDGSGKNALVRLHLRYWLRGLKGQWRGTHLAPRGSVTPTISLSLPPWHPDPQTLVTYRNRLGRIVARLQHEQMMPDYQRLESLFGVAGNETIAVDVLRLVRLENAVCNNGVPSDLALFVFGYLEGSAVGTQNGGASGPPH